MLKTDTMYIYNIKMKIKVNGIWIINHN